MLIAIVIVSEDGGNDATELELLFVLLNSDIQSCPVAPSLLFLSLFKKKILFSYFDCCLPFVFLVFSLVFILFFHLFRPRSLDA